MIIFAIVRVILTLTLLLISVFPKGFMPAEYNDDSFIKVCIHSQHLNSSKKDTSRNESKEDNEKDTSVFCIFNLARNCISEFSLFSTSILPTLKVAFSSTFTKLKKFYPLSGISLSYPPRAPPYFQS